MAKIDPVPAAAVRRAARHDRPREGRHAPRAQRDRGRAAGLHARAHAQRLVRDPRRGAEHEPRADEDVPHAPGLQLEDGHHGRHHPDRPPARPALGPRGRQRDPRRRSRASSSCASAAPTSCATASCSASSRPTTSTPSAPAPELRPRPAARPPSRVARVLDVEVIGDGGPQAPPRARGRAARRHRASPRPASTTGHVAVEFVDADRIAALNREHRGRAGPTDVLSFPVDGDGRRRRPARAGRHRHLPGAHRGPARGGRPRRAAPHRHGPRDRRRRDARAPGRAADLVATPVTRAGFVALAGRPNVGKSTLVNAHGRPQGGDRLRQAADDAPGDPRRGHRAATRSSCSSTCPGVQRPRDALTERMQHRVEREMAESDAALFVVNAEQGVGPGDRFIAGALRGAGVPVVIAVNKVDRLDRAAHARRRSADAAALDVGDEIFPVSARTGRGVAALREHLAGAHAREPVPVPGRGPLRPAARRAARRARPRAGAAAHVPGGARTRSRSSIDEVERRARTG